MSSKDIVRNLFTANSIFPFRSTYRGGDILLIAAWVLFSYTVFSGAVRKWVVGPGAANNVIFLGQLLIFFVFYLLASSSKLRPHFKVPVFFIIFFLYLVIAALNSKNHTIYHGLFGLLIHVGIWVALIAYYQRREHFELEKLIGFFIVVLVVEIILASVQYKLPTDHILNIKGDGNMTDALVGNAVRVSGTFSYLGGFHVMITFYGFLIWYMLVMEFPFFFTVSVFGLSLYGALMSGSRGAMFLLLFISGFAFIYTGFLFRRIINIVVTLAILISLLTYFADNIVRSVNTSYENFSQRVEWGQESGEADARVEDYLTEVVNFRGKYPIYGIGLGSTYQGANILFGESIYSKDYGYYESELVRIVLEGGFILFFFRIILLLSFLRYSYLPGAAKWVILIFFLGSAVTFNTYQGVFFLLGLIMVDRAYFIQQTKKRLVRS